VITNSVRKGRRKSAPGDGDGMVAADVTGDVHQELFGKERRKICLGRTKGGDPLRYSFGCGSGIPHFCGRERGKLRIVVRKGERKKSSKS